MGNLAHTIAARHGLSTFELRGAGVDDLRALAHDVWWLYSDTITLAAVLAGLALVAWVTRARFASRVVTVTIKR